MPNGNILQGKPRPHRSGDAPKNTRAPGQMDQEPYIHRMERHATVKVTQPLLGTPIWALREKGMLYMRTYRMVPFTQMPEMARTERDRSRILYLKLLGSDVSGVSNLEHGAYMAGCSHKTRKQICNTHLRLPFTSHTHVFYHISTSCLNSSKTIKIL